MRIYKAFSISSKTVINASLMMIVLGLAGCGSTESSQASTATTSNNTTASNSTTTSSEPLSGNINSADAVAYTQNNNRYSSDYGHMHGNPSYMYDSQGHMYNGYGHIYDSQGRVYSGHGHMYDSQGRIVDARGDMIADHPLSNVSATVYTDPDCSCCGDWMDHAHQAGMHTLAQHPDNLNVFKDRYGVPRDMRSCHTTVTEDGYVFEGHVPTKYIAQFLANPPDDAIGLAVPGMPVGSPGMEYENQFSPYTIYQINKDGSTIVYEDIDTLDQQN